jgi:hypothetical protein
MLLQGAAGVNQTSLTASRAACTVPLHRTGCCSTSAAAKGEAAVDARKAHSGLKRRLLNALKLGTGSLVLATSVSMAPPAAAATRPAGAPVLARAAELRAQLLTPQASAVTDESATQLAWWGNWHNWGGHPWWHNWPNWRNWHNWGNW